MSPLGVDLFALSTNFQVTLSPRLVVIAPWSGTLLLLLLCAANSRYYVLIDQFSQESLTERVDTGTRLSLNLQVVEEASKHR